MKDKFKIVDYNPDWINLYNKEKELLYNIFQEIIISVHHIGSTAIKTTKSKPEIDILIVVSDDSNLSKYDFLVRNLGYNIRGECLDNGGTPGRFYYSKDQNNKRTHKLHICKIGHFDIMNKLLFVKYLNDHEKVGKEYAKLKIKLSKRYNYGNEMMKYINGKGDFIKKVLIKSKKENENIQYEDFK